MTFFTDMGCLFQFFFSPLFTCFHQIIILHKPKPMKNKLLRLTSTPVPLLLVSVAFCFCPGKAITGKVTSKEEGGALPGVSVLVKGTTVGTITNTDGNYQLNVPDNATLVFSFIGFTSQEVAVGNRTAVDVAMLPDAKALSEVVVIGYGTQTKRAVTGSVASVGYDKFKDRSFSNVTQALAGELPGVNITQAQGAPGQSPIIRIRGISSITAGTNPLYVVDGLPMENFNLNNINPQDIESVEVLKDASSAAIYGSRGANGVVIITTKLGKPGKTPVNASYEYGHAGSNPQN